MFESKYQKKEEYCFWRYMKVQFRIKMTNLAIIFDLT